MPKTSTSPLLMAISLVIFSAVLAACDKVCNYTAEDVTPIQNLTGRDLKFSVCKFPGEKKQISVTSDQLNQVSLGSSQQTVIQGGGDALKSCNVPAGETKTTGIALSSENFNDFLLCKDNSKIEYLIVEVTESCPVGSSPQLSPKQCL